MNVTLGVPRLKEIINASKAISTPIITARLVKDDNKMAARMVKAAIEKTTLGEIAEFIKEVYAPGKCYISVKLDLRAIEQLKLEIDAFTVRSSILRGSPGTTRPSILRALKDVHVKVKKGTKSRLRIYVPDKSEKATTSSQTTYFAMQMLKVALPKVIVQGIPSVNRAVINEEDKDGRPSYHLLVEGYGHAESTEAPGVDGKQPTKAKSTSSCASPIVCISITYDLGKEISAETSVGECIIFCTWLLFVIKVHLIPSIKIIHW